MKWLLLLLAVAVVAFFVTRGASGIVKPSTTITATPPAGPIMLPNCSVDPSSWASNVGAVKGTVGGSMVKVGS